MYFLIIEYLSSLIFLSFIHSFIRLLIYSLVCSFIHSLANSFIHSFKKWFLSAYCLPGTDWVLGYGQLEQDNPYFWHLDSGETDRYK